MCFKSPYACMHPYTICYLKQQEWNSFARKCRLASAGWVEASVFNGCYMGMMHKDTAEFLRCSQINCFSCCWSKIEVTARHPLWGLFTAQPLQCLLWLERKKSGAGGGNLWHQIISSRHQAFICKAISKLWIKVERGLLMEKSQLQTPIWEEEGAINCLLLCSWDAQEEMTINSLAVFE